MDHDRIILVFYIYRDVLKNESIRKEYMDSIKEHFETQGMAPTIFFVPTDTEERIDCINPKYIEDQNEILKLKETLSRVEDLFDIGKISLNDSSTEKI